MKKMLIKHKKMFSSFIFLGLAFCLGANAQPVKYAYDATGNRLSREKVITMSRLKSAVGESGKSETEAAGLQKYEDTVAEMKITIYPNPTKGRLQVDISGGEIPKDARIYIYNVFGLIIRQLTGISETNHIDISAHPTGTYTMQIVLSKENISTWKIIKE